MIWYIADTSGGETYFVLAGPEKPGITKEQFFHEVLLAVKEEDGDDFTSQELSLHRMDTRDAERWIVGGQPPKRETWSTMYKRTLIGELRYVFPGEWELKES